MADYYPLIARAVAGLERNTGDARRVLYERARTALVAQLRGVTPTLSESDVTRERLALEEAIRKVEAESARQSRAEPVRQEPAQRVRAPEMPRWEDPPGAPGSSGQERQSGSQPPADALLRRPAAASRQANGPSTNGMFGNERYVDPVFDQPIANAQSAQSEPSPQPAAPSERDSLRERPTGERRSLLELGLSGFRNIVAGANGLGAAAARSAKPEPENDSSVAPPPRDFRAPDMKDSQAANSVPQSTPVPRLLEPAIDDETMPVVARFRMPPLPTAEELAEKPKRSLRNFAKIMVALLLIAGIGGGFLALWPTASEIYFSLHPPSSSDVAPEPVAPAPAPTGRTKITERFEPSGQQATQSMQPAGVAPGGAAVAQRVVLYEEDPGFPQGKRFVGSAIWRTETVSPGPGMPPEIAVRADVEIPERQIAVTWSFRRNADSNLPASHTVEIMFRLPQDFPAGGVSNVPGILMKQDEQSRGTPLSGLAVKVTAGFFLIGLSAVDADRERNLQLLKERAWFDIPVVYNNSRRAILALQKGAPGERAFAEAFRAWQQ